MSRKDDIFDGLENFEKHWGEMCKEFETAEMSKHDARIWTLDFRMDRFKFSMKMGAFIRNTYGNDIDTRLDWIEHKFSVAILKSRSNFREKEKIRLKDSYGIFWVLFYILFEIKRKI